MTHPAVSLRPAHIEDCALLAFLHSECFPQGWAVHEFGAFFTQQTALAALAHQSTHPIGFSFGLLIADSCELMLVGVLPAYRQRGIGHQLIHHLKAECQARGLARIFLEVGVRNPGAKALYASAGFVQIGLRKDYYTAADGSKDDAITMECRLS